MAQVVARPPRLSPDGHLRRWGFRIAGRPATGPALWRDTRTGDVVCEADARARATARERYANAGAMLGPATNPGR